MDPIQARTTQLIEANIGNLVVSVAQLNALLEAERTAHAQTKSELDALKAVPPKTTKKK